MTEIEQPQTEYTAQTENNPKINRSCPYCKSNRTQSKGKRGDHRRFECKACGKNHTRSITGELITVPEIEIYNRFDHIITSPAQPVTAQKTSSTISISLDVKAMLDSKKLIKQEPYDSVIRRLLRDSEV